QEAVPRTDGRSIWLPADLRLDDDAIAADCYKSIALQQAMRTRRGSADLLRAEWPPLLVDVYLLIEAQAADEALAQRLPGMTRSIERLRAVSLERRPPLPAFPDPRRDLELLARSFLDSPCGRASNALVTETPLDSRALAERLVAELAPDADAARAFGISP